MQFNLAMLLYYGGNSFLLHKNMMQHAGGISMIHRWEYNPSMVHKNKAEPK